MGGAQPSTRKGWKRFLLVIALPGLPLLLLLVLGRGMRHEFSDLDYFTLAGERTDSPVGARRLPDFHLTDQSGRTVERDDLAETFWLVAFFTTDTTTTPHLVELTQQLLWANWRYRDEPDVGLLCISLDSKNDQPARLEEYVSRNERYNRYPNKWRFLTGDQAYIDRMIEEDLGIPRDSADPFNIGTLLLVDGRGYVRQKYLASSEHEIGDAVEDIALLKKRKREAEKALEVAAEQFTPLPHLGLHDVVRHEDGTTDTLFYTTPKFALTDQLGRECSHRDVAGKVLLVDAFFTACPTICPVISSQLSRVHDRLLDDGVADRVRILTHTVDPERDTPERMRRYAERLGADPEVWRFLTGPKKELYPLLQEGYLLTALPSDTAQGGFFHSDQILLVDVDGHIRGSYDGTKTSAMDQLLENLYGLLATSPSTVAR